MGFELPLFHSPSWSQGAGNCGLLKIPETRGWIERLGCSPKWNHPLPLQPNFWSKNKRTRGLGSLQHDFCVHLGLENFSSLNEDFFPPSLLPTKRERAPFLQTSQLFSWVPIERSQLHRFWYSSPVTLNTRHYRPPEARTSWVRCWEPCQSTQPVTYRPVDCTPHRGTNGTQRHTAQAERRLNTHPEGEHTQEKLADWS